MAIVFIPERFVKTGLGMKSLTMYDCEDCAKAKKEHQITEIPGPPAKGNEVSYPGQPTTYRSCTGCGFQDGPWVPAPW